MSQSEKLRVIGQRLLSLSEFNEREIDEAVASILDIARELEDSEDKDMRYGDLWIEKEES